MNKIDHTITSYYKDHWYCHSCGNTMNLFFLQIMGDGWPNSSLETSPLNWFLICRRCEYKYDPEINPHEFLINTCLFLMHKGYEFKEKDFSFINKYSKQYGDFMIKLIPQEKMETIRYF